MAATPPFFITADAKAGIFWRRTESTMAIRATAGRPLTIWRNSVAVAERIWFLQGTRSGGWFPILNWRSISVKARGSSRRRPNSSSTDLTPRRAEHAIWPQGNIGLQRAMLGIFTVLSRSASAAWTFRRHHDRDGRDDWSGNFRESIGGGTSCSRAVFDSRRLVPGRPVCDVRRVYLGGVGRPFSGSCGRAIRLPAPGISSG